MTETIQSAFTSNLRSLSPRPTPTQAPLTEAHIRSLMHCVLLSSHSKAITFTNTEKVTLVLDLMVSSSERGHSKWVSQLSESDHVNMKFQNLWADNFRDVRRTALLNEALGSNGNLSNLKTSKFRLGYWHELYRGLTPLLQFSKLTKLDLSKNNLIDSSDTEVTSRE